MKRLCLSLILLLALTAHADTVASLLTFHAGPQIYELEGHTALRLRNDSTGMDIAVNWGIFDFASPGFVPRFVLGKTDYMAGAYPTLPYVDSYVRQGRRVVEQQLDLTPAQTARLEALIADNLLPEHRTYRYNYLYDNCATRPLALIEAAVGDSIRLAPDPRPQNTFRTLMAAYHEGYPWYQFGIDLALGAHLDRQLQPRHHAFAPVALEQMLAGATYADGRPVVSRTRVIAPFPPDAAILPPTPLWRTPTFCAWALFVIVSLLCLRRHGLPVVNVVCTVYYGIAALAGILLTFLIFLSVHSAAAPNWCYLWLNPFALFTAVAVWVPRWRRPLVWWQFCNFALCIALLLVALAGVQRLNAAFIPLILTDIVLSIKIIATRR